MDIRDTLVRLGADQLTQILGTETVKLLEVLDLRHVAPSSLADIVIQQWGKEELLCEPIIRSDLIQALPEAKAKILLNQLNLDDSDNPWSKINSLSFRKGSSATIKLLQFFGVFHTRREDKKESKAITDILPSYGLYDHQISACREVISHLSNNNRDRVLLHMPTGSGKTRTAMNVISYFLRYRCQNDQVVIWLAHNEELCDQAAEEFEKAWKLLGNREVPVYRCYGQYQLELSLIKSGFVVVSLQLLYSRCISQQSDLLALAQKVSLIIMDEAHQAIAPTYKHVLDILAVDPKTSILGLSATPGRGWLNATQDVQLANFFNRTKVKLNVEGYSDPIQYLQTEGFLAEVHSEYLGFKPTGKVFLTKKDITDLQNGLDLSLSVIMRLGDDLKRNCIIIEKLRSEIEQGNKIIVFACSVKHSNLITSVLNARGFKAASISGHTRADRRRDTISRFRNSDQIQVLTNYGVLSTGFDAPNANVAFITRPTQSVALYSQMVGRVVRGPKVGGGKTCKVVTIVDKLPGFRSISEAFNYWEDIWE